MAKSIIDKIWEAHVVKSKDGYPDIFAIDVHLMHEVTSPQAFDELRKRGLKMHASDRAFATVDHIISTAPDREELKDSKARKQVTALRDNCKEFGVELYDMGGGNQGVIHVVGPELGLIHPGMTVVCGDSHTATHGAFGALAFGIGTTEVSHVMATGCLLQQKPKTMKVEFSGRMPKGVTAKDLILKLISEIGVGGGAGHIIEYTGNVISDLSMEERMTICNMSIECGARSGLVAPDETTFEYLQWRPGAPEGKKLKKSIEKWMTFISDEDAEYDKEVKIDVSKMSPMVTWGTNPAEAVEIDEEIPNGDEKSLKYVGLKAGSKIEGTKIDYVFIGSCTNGRISDLRAAASIFKGKKVADGIKAYVVPGSEQVEAMAILEGLDKIFIEAGALWRKPGCSMCLAMNDDIVPEGKRCASTSNRNFVGRQGKGSITHLMSPDMAAAAAVKGKITDVRKIK